MSWSSSSESWHRVGHASRIAVKGNVADTVLFWTSAFGQESTRNMGVWRCPKLRGGASGRSSLSSSLSSGHRERVVSLPLREFAH